MADYDYSKTIGGYKGPGGKSNNLGRIKGTRGAWSNNLPFRAAGSLAPYSEYNFLFPTGTEKGAVWSFGNSAGQYQTPGLAASAGDTRISAVGQTLGEQLDIRIPPVPHDLDLDSRAYAYTGAGANTVGVSGDTIVFDNAAAGDGVNFGAGEFPVPQWGRLEAVLLIDNPTKVAIVNGILVNVGNGGNLLILSPGKNIYIVCSPFPSVSGNFNFSCFTAMPGVRVTVKVLSITGYPGNHLAQNTATARPLTAIETVGTWGQSVYSARFDGIDDGLSTPTFAAGTLSNNMDFFCAIKRNSAAKGASAASSMDAFHYLGYYDPAGAGVATSSGAGVPTIFVNGVAVADDRKLLSDALGVGQWAVLEYRNLDLSVFTNVGPSNLAAALVSGNYGDTILCPAQSAANRSLARQLVGASVGLNLS